MYNVPFENSPALATTSFYKTFSGSSDSTPSFLEYVESMINPGCNGKGLG